MSLFVTFEGSEGCGKSTQAKALWRRLLDAGMPAELTYEPGGTPLGDKLRRLLKQEIDENIAPLSELMLFIVCRAELVNKVIRPGLEQGKVVVCDRFADSTLAYQGYGRGLDLKMIEYLNGLATGGIKPDLTILLDLPVGRGLGRKAGDVADRFESEDIVFHNKVRDGYLKLATREPERWLVIDANLPETEIGEIIWRRVKNLFHRKK